MSTPCTITGTLRDPAGAVMADTPVRVVSPRAIAVVDDGIVLPVVETAQSDGNGAITFAMLSGVYRLVWTRTGRVPFASSLTVPDAATADLQDCIPGVH